MLLRTTSSPPPAFRLAQDLRTAPTAPTAVIVNSKCAAAALALTLTVIFHLFLSSHDGTPRRVWSARTENWRLEKSFRNAKSGPDARLYYYYLCVYSNYKAFMINYRKINRKLIFFFLREDV